MNHQMVQEKIWMVQDRELPDADRQAVLAHLKTCTECTALARRWQVTQRLMARVPELEVSEAFVSAVMDRLPAAPVFQPARQRWALPWWIGPQLEMGLAGVLLTLLLIKPQPAIATEALLLSGSPNDSHWEFSSHTPDPNLLLQSTQGETP